MDHNKNNNNTADDFWNLEAIVPQKRALSVFDKWHTEAVDIESPASDYNSNNNKNTELIPNPGVIKRYVDPISHQAEKKQIPDVEYNPQKSLIHVVRLFPWSSGYPYYEGFRKSAMYYYNKSSSVAKETPYFSYMPQYSQLDDTQLSFYLWLRNEIREGRYPSADYSYLLLLIYETINLSDKIPVERSVDLLVNIWLNYRGEYPRLDAQLSEWIFDMCLIGKISPPVDCLAIVGDSLPATAGLREFYGNSIDDSDSFANLLMSYCSNYDFHKSKFASGDNLAVYERHIKGALSYIISKCSDPSHPFVLSGLKMQDSKTKRDAYTGALCTPKVKKRIELEYCSFSHSHELRFIVTDILKYSENKIRSYLGIKSKLSVSSLNDDIKSLINRYFDEHLPINNKLYYTDEQSDDYEKLYEPAKSELSFEAASMIEQLSWETTERFVDALNSDENFEAMEVFEIPEYEKGEEADMYSGFNDFELRFIVTALKEDFVQQKQISNEMDLIPDLIADKINSKSADILGDILLEECEQGYVVLEDYRNEVEEVIKDKIQKR